MCKLAMAAKITDDNRNDVWVFLQLLGELMTLGNNDGLGYAAFDKSGSIFGEKWLINQSAFKDLSQIKGINPSKMEKIYSNFGNVERDQARAIILHTRAATCGKGILNVHPFVDNDETPTTAIVHNGMIYNDSKFTRKYSTCDSEVLAHLYAENQVGADLSNVSKFSEKLQGWYTVLALSKDAKGRMVMDAFSDTGRLSSYFIKELNTRIYSSSGEDIIRVAKSLDLTLSDHGSMHADAGFRVDVETGEETEYIRFKSSPTVTSYAGTGYEGWDNLLTMEGNLDDEEFRNQWFRGWRGHHND